jgi:hypothetical protein
MVQGAGASEWASEAGGIRRRYLGDSSHDTDHATRTRLASLDRLRLGAL